MGWQEPSRGQAVWQSPMAPCPAGREPPLWEQRSQNCSEKCLITVKLFSCFEFFPAVMRLLWGLRFAAR